MKKVKKLNLIKFVQDVYSLSSPQGMGILHYQPGNLTDEEATKIIAQCTDDERLGLSMDYVRGRACKMVVWRGKDGGYELPDSWFDHTESQYAELLKRHSIQ